MKLRIGFDLIAGIAVVLVFFLFATGCEDSLTGPDAEGGGLEVIDADLAEQQVNDGIAYLEEGEWEEAYDSFSQAVYNDYTNPEAIAYYTVCDIASISTDDDLQTLASGMLGIEGYPTTMNDVFAPGWLTGEFTDGVDTITGIPEINIPGEIAAWEDDASNITMGEYLLAVAYNAVTYLSNNGGINALYDTLVDLLGPRLDNTIAAIQGLSDDAQIDLTYGMFSADGSVPYWWPVDGNNDPLVITIGKAEILMEAYYLQTLKVSLYMIKAYDFSLPLMEYWENFNPIDNSYDTTPITPVNGWDDVPSPIAEGFLYARDDAATSLGVAKSAMTGALNTIQDIIDLVEARGTGSGFTLAQDSPISDIASSWDYVDTMLGFTDVSTTKMLSSINSANSTFIYPVDMANFTDEYGYMDIMAYYDYYSEATNWPAGVDWGTFNEEEGYPETPPTAIGVNLSAVYTTPLWAINNLIELDSGGEPLWYKFEMGETALNRVSSSPVSSISLNEAQTGNYNYLYAFKVKDLTLNGLIEIDEDMYDSLKAMLLEMVGGPDYVESDFVDDENSDGSIEVYVPIVQPYLAYHTFAPADQAVYVSDLDINMVTTGSFWYALQYQNIYY